jgi:L-lactate dehydrogenase (cytochrome)
MHALALGARSCMIGRAYAYGLGAGGEAGVAKALDILGKEMLTTMGLCGVDTVAEIDDDALAVTIPRPAGHLREASERELNV